MVVQSLLPVIDHLGNKTYICPSQPHFHFQGTVYMLIWVKMDLFYLSQALFSLVLFHNFLHLVHFYVDLILNPTPELI